MVNLTNNSFNKGSNKTEGFINLKAKSKNSLIYNTYKEKNHGKKKYKVPQSKNRSNDLINKINNLILWLTGFAITKPFPKHSIRFAKEYFKDNKITAIEIGTFKGANAKDILDNLNIKKLYLIDPYDDYIDSSNEYKNRKVPKDLLTEINKIAERRLKKYKEKIEWVKRYSDDASNYVPIADYIYIDGNHSYNQVKKDIKNYFDKVKPGGILAGHDISMTEVLNAVQDFTREKDINFQVAGQDWWLIVNPNRNNNLGGI